jgi:hypothetical protein
MCFGLVAAALGQQADSRYDQPAPQNASGAQADSALSQPAPQQPPQGLPAPGAPQERSIMMDGQKSGRSAMSNGQQRGELGVWLVETQGPGVTITRVTRGSAAEQAGLREGDVILQVNGRGAASPQRTAEMIREIPIGQSGMLTVWRDGDQQQIQVTLQPARERPHELAGEMMREPWDVGFRGEEGSGSESARIARLEQQIAALTQQISALRQELATLRTSGGPQAASFQSETTQGSSQPGAGPLAPPPAAPTSAPATAAPPPGFGQPEEQPAKPASEPAQPATPPASEKPAPAAEKPAGDDLFGSAPAKSENKPEPESKSGTDTKSDADDLFK